MYVCGYTVPIYKIVLFLFKCPTDGGSKFSTNSTISENPSTNLAEYL